MAELYTLIHKLNNLQEQVEQLRSVVVYKNEMAEALKELEGKFEEMFQNAIQRLGTIARDEISNVFDPFHDSLKTEFKICLDAALRRIGH